MDNADHEKFLSLMGDCPDGDDNLPGWRRLLKSQADLLNGLWTETAALAGELTIAPRGNPDAATANLHGRAGKPAGSNAPHRGALLPEATPDGRGANRCPTDRHGRLQRTLLNLKKDPEACKAKGTTPEKVEAAYGRLVRGLVSV